MKFINPKAELIAFTPDAEALIEKGAKICTRRKENGDFGIISRLKEKGHLSVLEHPSATVEITCNRSVSHELVRHRLASFSQESQRYVKEGRDIEFIIPHWAEGRIEEGQCETGDLNMGLNVDVFAFSCLASELAYGKFEQLAAEDRRDVLVNAVATKILVTANFREWLHIFKLRCSPQAGKEIRRVMKIVLEIFKRKWPLVF